MFIILYLILYLPLTTAPAIVFASRSRSCNGYVILSIHVSHTVNFDRKIQVTRSRQCKLQMALLLALGLWASLLLFLWRRSQSGSKVSVMTMRLGNLLITTSALCVLAMLGEIAYSLSVMRSGGSSGQFFGFAALGKLVALIVYPMSYLPYRALL